MKKKLLLIFLFVIGINLFSNTSINEKIEFLNNLKSQLIIRYKTEVGIDFSDFKKNTPKEIRIFKETLYLHFISEYVDDIKDIKIFEKKKNINVILFADKKIDKESFNMIFDIITLNEPNFKVNLIQVPDSRNKIYGDVIQERYTER